MKITLSWLKQYLDTECSLQEITDKLTDLGLEVESVIDFSSKLSSFVIANVVSIKEHPNANKLSICQVDTGNQILDIVCGAPNVRAGVNVVLALIGSVVPTNGLKIKKSKIRGVESNGMLCSESELGIGKDSDGIIIMPEDRSILGQECTSYLGLDDPIIEIAITPNRGDCLGVYGVARDLVASGMGKLKPLSKVENSSVIINPFTVTVDSSKCSVFSVRYYEGVKNCTSPPWLKNKLSAIGLQPISALVDISNYLMFSFGQPMHIYNADKLTANNITICELENDEKFTALNDKEYDLQSGDLVIKDGTRTIALAGIIGGQNTECSIDSGNICLEVGNFLNINATNNRLKIESEASYRFERKVDPCIWQFIQDEASRLITEVCGGKVSEVAVYQREYEENIVPFSLTYLYSYSGVDIPETTVINILLNLGYEITSNHNQLLRLRVPSWRTDVKIEETIIADILRIYGYGHLSGGKLVSNKKVRMPSKLVKAQQAVGYLVANGYNETVNWSFTSGKKANAHIAQDENLIRIINPINDNSNVMRRSLLSNLLGVVSYNLNRGYNSLSVCEMGNVFYGTNNQKFCIAGVRLGNNIARNCFEQGHNFDFFDIKRDFEDILQIYNIKQYPISRDVPDYYHPYRSVRVQLGKNLIGYFGELHPSIHKLHNLKTKSRIVGFEIFVDNIISINKSRAKFEVTDFPMVARDFSFMVDSSLEVGNIVKPIKSVSKLIAEVRIFDVYENITDNKKSVSCEVILGAKDRTLTDKDIVEVSGQLIDLMRKKFSAKLRLPENR